MARTVLAREVVKAFDDEDIIEEEPVATNESQPEQEPGAQAKDTPPWAEEAAEESNPEQEEEAPAPVPAPKPAAPKTTPKPVAPKVKEPAVKKETPNGEMTTEDSIVNEVVNALSTLDKAITKMFDFYQTHYASIKSENTKLREHNEALKKFFDTINAAVDTHNEQ